MIQMLAVRAEVVAVAPWLNHMIMLECLHGFRGPALHTELNIGVDRRDIFRIRWQARNPNVQGILFVPYQRAGVSPDLDMVDVRIAELKWPIAEFDLDCRKLDSGIKHLLFERIIEF
jgi:hypothetical protein